MHTIKVIAGGLLLLGVCLIIGRAFGGPGSVGLVTGAKLFIPLWLITSGVNLWVGVSRAGYSIADEAPIFLVVFAVPSAMAVLVWWAVSRGG
jgi:hypothetical protein